MPIKVTCGGCGATLSTPDSSAGKRAKCPKCGSIIEIPSADDGDDALDPLASPLDGLSESEMTSGEVQQDDRKPCPACGEMIMRGAMKCRFCGEIFDPTLKEQEKKKRRKSVAVADEDEDLSAGEWVLAILCSGIGCILGIVWMIQGKPKGKKMFFVSLAVQGFWFIVQVILGVISEGM